MDRAVSSERREGPHRESDRQGRNSDQPDGARRLKTFLKTVKDNFVPSDLRNH